MTNNALKPHRQLLRPAIAAGILVGLGLTLRFWRDRLTARPRGTDLGADPASKRDADASQVAQSVRWSLLYVLPPTWLAAALADWACHRYSRIEDTAGVKESLIHLALLGEMGVPILATASLEITSPVILIMISAFLAHEVTVYGDLRLAAAEREVTPTEQMVHSFMEIIPLIGIWLASVLREDELRALLGAASRSPDFSLRLKEKPLSLRYHMALLTGMALFGGIPYLEELWRTARAAIGRSNSSY